MKPGTIMIVENNTDLRNALRHAFENRGYLTWSCQHPEMAVSIFTAIRPDVVLLDLDLETINPLSLLDAWMEIAPDTRIIVQSMDVDTDRMRDAMEHGAHAFLLKTHPLTPLFELLKQEEHSYLPADAPFTREAA